MPVAIYDVAIEARVGTGTASRVLNNSSKLLPATRELALKDVNEPKYQLFTSTQGLAHRTTLTIAILIPFIAGHFCSDSVVIELLRNWAECRPDNESDLRRLAAILVI